MSFESKGELLIGGRWRAAEVSTLPVVKPSDGEVFTQIGCGEVREIGAAVTAARAAFDGAWCRLPAVERGRLLMKLTRAVADHHDALSETEAKDRGKPLKQARADIAALARYFEYYAGAADKVHGETLPRRASRRSTASAS